jgi:hypothetical protein
VTAPTMSRDTELRALVQKWRDAVADDRKQPMRMLENVYLCHGMESCADELEALLTRTEAGACTNCGKPLRNDAAPIHACACARLVMNAAPVANGADRWKAEYECAQQRGDMLDDLCTSNARALFRAMNPGASDDEIEYEDSHDITQQAVRALTHPHDASAGGAVAWTGLTEQERAEVVSNICAYGTEFVTPLFAVIEGVEKRLKDRNTNAQDANAKNAVGVRYDLVQNFAVNHRLDYNEVSAFVRSVIATSSEEGAR